jgi:hypothetical protein
VGGHGETISALGGVVVASRKTGNLQICTGAKAKPHVIVKAG